MRNSLFGVMAMLCALPLVCFSQSSSEVYSDSLTKLAGFPNRLFNKISSKTAALQRRLDKQTASYLQNMSNQEARLKNNLSAADSAKAAALYPSDPRQQYAALLQKYQQAGAVPFSSMGPEYLAHVDSLQGALGFLNKNSSILGGNAAMQGKVQMALANFQQLQSKLQYADVIRQYVQNRKNELQQALSSYSKLPSGIGSALQGYKKQAYYYGDQVRTYRAMLNDPDKMMQTALVMLNKLPAFTAYMKQHSFLAGVLGVPAGYGTEQGMVGLQTREQVVAAMQKNMGSASANPAAALQGGLNAATQDIQKLQNKLSSLGGGSGGMDEPDFKPSDQHSKRFFNRLLYGFNLQTTRGNLYFPTYTDVGVSLGYNLGHSNSVGIGASYKIGWGTDWQHIAFSSQGTGLRSWADIHLFKSFSATGGFEMNYVEPFGSWKVVPNWSDWTSSGLIGISKSVTMKNAVLKKTQVQLLWDFLSYHQIPQQPPVIFRVGYTF